MFFLNFFWGPGEGVVHLYHNKSGNIMTTNEYIIKATLIAYKQSSISLDDAVKLIVDELDLDTEK